MLLITRDGVEIRERENTRNILVPVVGSAYGCFADDISSKVRQPKKQKREK